jgi:ABC-type bacteriocin/lantibiotic exporter with double-glycine peptidase domain
MRIQEREYSCGPAAVSNALRALGKKVSERRVIKKLPFYDHPVKGTSDDEVCFAVRQLGYRPQALTWRHARVAWADLTNQLKVGRPVICMVDRATHFVVVLGMLGDDLVVFDSIRRKANLEENGVHVTSKRAWIKRWRQPAHHHHRYTGVAVAKR